MTILGVKPNYRNHTMDMNLAHLSLGTAPLKLDTLLEVLNKNLASNRMPNLEFIVRIVNLVVSCLKPDRHQLIYHKYRDK
jgi:hypothetical protein